MMCGVVCGVVRGGKPPSGRVPAGCLFVPGLFCVFLNEKAAQEQKQKQKMNRKAERQCRLIQWSEWSEWRHKWSESGHKWSECRHKWSECRHKWSESGKIRAKANVARL